MNVCLTGFTAEDRALLQQRIERNGHTTHKMVLPKSDLLICGPHASSSKLAKAKQQVTIRIVTAAEIANTVLGPEDIVARNPELYAFNLDRGETVAISENGGLSHIALSSILNPVSDVAGTLGFSEQAETGDILYSIVTDAIMAYHVNTYVHYSRGWDAYPKYLGMPRRRLNTAMEFLVENGLIRLFIVCSALHMPIRSFFRATAKLVEACGDHIDIDQVALKPDLWSVQCTIRQYWGENGGQSIATKHRVKLDGDDYTEMNRDIIAQNIFLQQANIGFEPPQSQLIERYGTTVKFRSCKGVVRTTNLANIIQRRVFVRDKVDSILLLGGRFYGGFWQGLSKNDKLGLNDRECITFDGEPAGEEFDFTSLHAQIGYAALNEAMPDNPYYAECAALDVFENEGIRRGVCKLAFFMALNAKSIRGGAGALATELIEIDPAAVGVNPDLIPPMIDGYRKKFKLTREERAPAVSIAMDIIRTVMEHNDPIKAFICSDKGVMFQHIDADIMARAQRRCREEGIPVLGLHDSFVAPVSKTNRAKEIFQEELEAALARLRRAGLSAYGID